jgi:type VI secretion system protein ImpM
MPFAFKPARDATPRYAVFGKLPRRADFVRISGGTHLALQEFDDLLTRSLAAASRQPDWDETTCLGEGASDFQFTSSDGHECFTGVLHPSRDETGRFFPLVAGVILPASAIVPYFPELIIANELFYSGLRDQLTSAIDHAVDLVACRQFLDTWSAPNPHAQDDIDLAAQILARHMERTQVVQWHAALMEAGLGGLDDCLLAFVCQTVAAHGTNAPILLPLSRVEGESALDQAAWLALYRAAGNGHSPDYLCTVRDGRRHLAISPWRFGKGFLAALWARPPEQPDGNVLWKQRPAQAEAAWVLARQLQDPTLSLAPLCTTLERLHRNLAGKPSREHAFPLSFIN